MNDDQGRDSRGDIPGHASEDLPLAPTEPSQDLVAEPPAPAVAEAAERSRNGDWAYGFVLQLLVAGFSVTALQATRPMVTYRALGLDAGPFEIGLVQSAFSIVPVFTAVALGRWVDRIGEARFLTVAMAAITAGSVVVAFSNSLVLLALGQAVMGFGQITSLVAGQAMIANRGPRDRREHRYGWYSTVASLGQLAGPAIGAVLVGGAIAGSIGSASGAVPPAGPFADNPEAPVFLFSAVASGIACLLSLRLPRRRPQPTAATDDGIASLGLAAAAMRVLRRPGMAAAMLVSITVISAVDVLVAYLPAYGEQNGLSVETVGLLLSVRAGASLISRVFMGRMIERLGRERLLATSMAMAGIGIVALPFVGSIPVLFALMILIGLGLGLGQPMTIAWVANRSPRPERGLALGVRLTGNRGALLIVPTMMGAIAGASGLTAIWLVLAMFLGAGSFVASRTPFDELVARPRTAGPEPAA